MASQLNTASDAWISGVTDRPDPSSPILPPFFGAPRFSLPSVPSLDAPMPHYDASGVDAGLAQVNEEGSYAHKPHFEDDDEVDGGNEHGDDDDLIVVPTADAKTGSVDRTLDAILPDLPGSDYSKLSDEAYAQARESNAAFAILPIGVNVEETYLNSKVYVSVRSPVPVIAQGSPQRVKILPRRIKPEAATVRQARLKRYLRSQQEADTLARAAAAAAEQATCEAERQQLEALAAKMGANIKYSEPLSTPSGPRKHSKKSKDRAPPFTSSKRRQSSNETGDDEHVPGDGQSVRFTDDEKRMVYELVFNEMDNFDGDSSDSGSEYMSIDDSIQRAKHITMLKHGKRLPPWLFFKQMQTVWWRKAEPRLNRAGSYRKFDSYYNLIKRDKDLYKSCLEAFNVTGGSRPDEETREDDDRPSRGELLADQANQAFVKFYTSEWFPYWEESPVKDTEHLTRDFALTELGGVVPKNTRKRAKPQSSTDEDNDEEALHDKETLAAEEAEDEDTRRKVIKGKGRARAKPQSSANNHDPVFNGFIKTITDIEKRRFQNETVVAEHAAAKAKIDADEAKVKAKDARFEAIKRWTERLQAFRDEGDVEREAIARVRLNRLNDELLDEDE